MVSPYHNLPKPSTRPHDWRCPTHGMRCTMKETCMRFESRLRAPKRDEVFIRIQTINEAWARFYVASENVFVMAIGSTGEGRDLAPERAKREAAREALRALGVDVDTLLKEADR